MKKRDELSKPNSCLSKASSDEMLFVLLARDPAAPATIREWIKERVRLGMNLPTDPKIVEAERCADEMERQRTQTGVSR